MTAPPEELRRNAPSHLHAALHKEDTQSTVTDGMTSHNFKDISVWARHSAAIANTCVAQRLLSCAQTLQPCYTRCTDYAVYSQLICRLSLLVVKTTAKSLGKACRLTRPSQSVLSFSLSKSFLVKGREHWAEREKNHRR